MAPEDDEMPEVVTGLYTVNPLRVLTRWIDHARAVGLAQPSTMTFATTSDTGPHARTVLVTEVDVVSLRFHSSTPTTKTKDLADDDRAAGVFHWPSLGRQVILTGRAVELSRAVSERGYLAQPRNLQLIAWAYDTLLPGLSPPDLAISPDAMDREFDAHDSLAVSRVAPPSWTTIGFTPDRVDFWRSGAAGRPNVKTRYQRSAAGLWRSFSVLP